MSMTKEEVASVIKQANEKLEMTSGRKNYIEYRKIWTSKFTIEIINNYSNCIKYFHKIWVAGDIKRKLKARSIS